MLSNRSFVPNGLQIANVEKNDTLNDRYRPEKRWSGFGPWIVLSSVVARPVPTYAVQVQQTLSRRL